MPVPLEIEEARFRDLGDPLLRYVRRITADRRTVAVIVMPEPVFSGPQRLLHNQRALYVKRLLPVRAPRDPHERAVPAGLGTTLVG